MFWVAAELPPQVPAQCVIQAAEHYELPVVALVAVAQVENGKVGVRYDRSSGSYFGPYQISDKWIPALDTYGYTASALQYDACANARAGAYILAQYRYKEGGDIVRALGRYNVGSLNTPERIRAAQRYVTKILAHWRGIYSRHHEALTAQSSSRGKENLG